MSHPTLRRSATALAVMWLGSPLAAQPVVFDFERTPEGTWTPFCDVRPRLSACFDAGTFFGHAGGMVHDFGHGPDGIPGMNGHVLGALPSVDDPFVAQISMSFGGLPPFGYGPPSKISFDFMLTLVGAVPVPIQLDAFLGGQHVDTCVAEGRPFSVFGRPPDRQVGTLTCSPGPFDYVRLDTQQGELVNFYVDNIAVNAPEPGSVVLLVTGLVATLGAIHARRLLA
jgi:hypothetical protein